MDTSAEQSHLRNASKPPVLIVGTSEAAVDRARATADVAGFRIAQPSDFAAACARIEQQLAASAVWVEIDRDCGPVLDRLLKSVGGASGNGRFPAVVSSTGELLDVVFAQTCDDVELIVDADDATRIAALAIACAQPRLERRIADVASDRNGERLRQLSDEVGRIAATLARLSSNPPIAGLPHAVPAQGEVPPISVETVRAVIRARRLRSRYFSEDLFADPAWDMMLDLLQAEVAQLRVPVSSLCIAAAVPATTALRWLKKMVDEGLFLRRADPHDGRRVFVELAKETSDALRRYFAEVGTPATI